MWYCPELRFLGFDLRVETAAGERRFLDFVDAAAAAAAGAVRSAARDGSLAECLEHPVEIESTVPATFGLPPIAGNLAEGVVIRPAREPLRASDRGLFKRKIPQFSETRYTNNGWRDAKRGGGGGAAGGGGGPSDEELHGFEILARVTPPRLAAS